MTRTSPLPTSDTASDMTSAIAGAGQHASHWVHGLTGTLSEIPPEQRVRGALQALVALWIGHRGMGADARALREHAAATRALLDRDIGAAGRWQLVACDAALVLVATGILRALGTPSEPAEAFAGDLAAALAALSPSDDASPEMALVGALLQRLGAAGPLPRTVVIPGDATLLIQADDRQIHAVVAAIDHAVLVGRPPRDLTSDIDALQVALAVWSVDLCRRYQLPLAAAVARAMALVGMPDDARYHATAAFLAAQQQPDGRFGYYGVELTACSDDAVITHPDVELYLPVTLAVMHALAEIAAPHFRLYRSLDPT